MKELKSVVQKQFLERKGITYEQCTSRQKQILKTETPVMWELYQWDDHNCLIHDPLPVVGVGNSITGYVCSVCNEKM
jgi:hypothetical protein